MINCTISIQYWILFQYSIMHMSITELQ